MKSNSRLQKDVYEELRWDPRINEGDIGVSADNGIITLSGSIPNFAEKFAAEEAAERVAGVAAIVNKIDVKLPGSLKRDDTDIAAAATNTLKWNVWVPSDKIKVHVENGWITLKGDVEWSYQKNTVETALRNIPGVRGITNELALKQLAIKPDVKAEEVKNKIEQALLRSAREDAKKIIVSISDGAVKLSGEVHSWSEKHEAEWAAWGTPGVRKVTNDVRVHM